MDPSFRWIEGRSPDELIQTRIDGLKQWLSENYVNCGKEQKHLDEGTSERAYWHFGYLCALRDVFELIYGDSVKSGTTRTLPS
jgi:hypothetical protein